MKILSKLILSLFLIGTVSCRDSKKQEEADQAALHEIEAIENEAEVISEEVEEDAKALEAALNDLDEDDSEDKETNNDTNK